MGMLWWYVANSTRHASNWTCWWAKLDGVLRGRFWHFKSVFQSTDGVRGYQHSFRWCFKWTLPHFASKSGVMIDGNVAHSCEMRNRKVKSQTKAKVRRNMHLWLLHILLLTSAMPMLQYTMIRGLPYCRWFHVLFIVFHSTSCKCQCFANHAPNG